MHWVSITRTVILSLKRLDKQQVGSLNMIIQSNRRSRIMTPISIIILNKERIPEGNQLRR